MTLVVLRPAVGGVSIQPVPRGQSVIVRNVGLRGPQGPDGLSALSVLVENGTLPHGSSPQDLADYLREPAVNLVEEEAEIRSQVFTARDEAQESAESARQEAEGAALAQSGAELARDAAVRAANQFDLLLVIAQRLQTTYGISDFSQAFLFARQGAELLFVQNYYRNGLTTA